MSNASQPGKPPQNQPASFEDIPIAEREAVEPPKVKPRSTNFSPWIGGAIAIGLVLGGWAAYQAVQLRAAAPTNPASTPQTRAPGNASGTPTPADRILNHFAYPEAPQAELEAVSADGGIRLRSSAAKAFRDMVASASAQGVILVPLSGFRSLSEQQQVYFDVKAERAQTPEQRALVSAPPGYSEHHTGYAIDVGDGSVPAANLSPNFEETPAFQWLAANAVRFNFEMSFPKANKQGVTYEPWHWRFVGDKNSLETFYKARQSFPQAPPQ